MDLEQGMAETVAPAMPSATEIAAWTWLPNDELAVYSMEYGRTGFQGGLQAYLPTVHTPPGIEPWPYDDPRSTTHGNARDTPGHCLGLRRSWTTVTRCIQRYWGR